MRAIILFAMTAAFLWPCTISAEEILSGVSERDFALDNRYSVGLDDLPWNASAASFRMWKDDERGIEISVGKIDFSFAEQGADATSRYLTLDLVRFDWLRRSQPLSLEGLFLVRGYGLGLSGNARENELDRRDDEYYRDEYYLRQQARIYLYLYMPLGIEYFFWKKYPSISFSVQADFFCRFGYGYDFEYRRYYNQTDEYENHSGYFTLGLDPAFFFRFYFK